MPKAPYLYKQRTAGQVCRKETEIAKAEGDLCDAVLLETLVPKWMHHLLVQAALMASVKPSLMLYMW